MIQTTKKAWRFARIHVRNTKSSMMKSFSTGIFTWIPIIVTFFVFYWLFDKANIITGAVLTLFGF